MQNMNSIILNQIIKEKKIKASDTVNWLLSHGVSSITTDELAALLGIPKNQVPQRMAALKRRKEIISPAQGLWIPVPPEYMTWGAPQAIDMINAMMKHLNAVYYVGWLSAAALLGASHHAPQVFQVATSRAIKARTVGRSRIKFYNRERVNQVPLIQVATKNGEVSVSSRETTLLDVSNDIWNVGGIDHAANLIIELCETAEPDMDVLVALSELYPVTAGRRLGFLMANYTESRGLDKLELACAKRDMALSLLSPQAGYNGAVDARWNIRINQEVSPDV